MRTLNKFQVRRHLGTPDRYSKELQKMVGAKLWNPKKQKRLKMGSED